MIAVKLADLRAAADMRPAGYYDHVVSMGAAVGDTLMLDPAIHADLARQYREGKLPEPTITEMVVGLAHSLSTWADSGYAVTDPQEARTRAETCRSCEHYDAAARMGLGRCGVCGCTNIKWWLKSEKCPIGKW
jgi:hypothetical protein